MAELLRVVSVSLGFVGILTDNALRGKTSSIPFHLTPHNPAVAIYSHMKVVQHMIHQELDILLLKAMLIKFHA